MDSRTTRRALLVAAPALVLPARAMALTVGEQALVDKAVAYLQGGGAAEDRGTPADPPAGSDPAEYRDAPSGMVGVGRRSGRGFSQGDGLWPAENEDPSLRRSPTTSLR